MLYITTRNSVDKFTSHIPLLSDTAADGGHYLPHRIPRFSDAEIARLKDTSFSQTVCDVLNAFFSCRLNALDVEFTIGKNPIKLVPVNHRLFFAELWRNPDSDFAYFVQQLHNKLLADNVVCAASDWSKTSVYIAVMFGVYGKILQEGLLKENATFDVSVPGEDFLLPMATWYARQIGLPIKTIICACDEPNSFWDLMHRGTVVTAQLSKQLQLGLEKLVVTVLGQQELQRFIGCCEKGSVYSLDPLQLSLLSNGFFCTVAGKNRSQTAINSLYRSNMYLTEPATALCYGGSQDYRAATGNTRPVLLLSRQSPLLYKNEIMDATGIHEDVLNESVKR